MVKSPELSDVTDRATVNAPQRKSMGEDKAKCSVWEVGEGRVKKRGKRRSRGERGRKKRNDGKRGV